MIGAATGRRWVVTLAVVLTVALGAAVGVAGLRLAELRSVPLASPRAVPPPGAGAGAATVEVSLDVWTHPAGPAVRELLRRHFDAINTRNYVAWAGTVVPAKVSQLPEPAWLSTYASTMNGTIRISRIDEQSPGRLIALVSYISTQRRDSAPDGPSASRTCWRAAFSLVGDPPLIDVSRSGSLLQGPC